MSKKHDKDFLMSRKYATFVANEYAKRIEKAIEYIETAKRNEENDNMKEYNYTKEDLLNILQGEDKDE